MDFDIMTEEIWKDIPEFEGEYKISNYGRCYSLKRRKYMNLELNSCGYYRIRCNKKGQKFKKFFVHRLVALLFVDGYKDGYVVDHIDGNKTNNIYTNLEWVSNSVNTKRSFDLGLKKPKKIKLTPCYVVMNGGRKLEFDSVVKAGRYFNNSEKRLHYLFRFKNGFIPELNATFHKCVSNDQS